MAHKTLLRLLPRSLFGRIALILFTGLAAAHILSFALVMYERVQAGTAMMAAYVVRDVTGAIAILERAPKGERTDWLKLLDRPNYRYSLGDVGDAAAPAQADALLAMLREQLGPAYRVTASRPRGATEPLQLGLHTQLHDGTPLTVELSPPRMSVSPWVAVALTLQLAVLGLFTWFAVRIATEPLTRLQRAADALGPELNGAPLPQDGPNEVARAAGAFNAMQRRIADHLAERARIVAAISHDLQTPITRMRLRADLLDDEALRRKLHGDLHEMQVLVEQGIDFARGRDSAEPPCPTDLHALLDSLICDYTDAGADVRLIGEAATPVTTRPRALRRIVTNLIDNALKFGREAEVKLRQEPSGGVAVSVLDRGPGIPDDKLQIVLQPFVRLEESRSRNTGGSGLGLAIAQQLTATLDGTLTLSNRNGGGLEAQLCLPRHGTS